MNFRFTVLAVALGALPISSYGQTTPPPARTPTLAEAEKVLQGISANKAKLQTYCDVAQLNEQMLEAQEKKDTTALQELTGKADRLEESLGQDYAELMLGLEQVDPSSAEGKQISGAFAKMDEKCSGLRPK